MQKLAHGAPEAMAGFSALHQGAVRPGALDTKTKEFTEWEPVITTWSITLSLGISCTTGVVFGLYPARRAAMMNPIQALRHR